MYLEENEPVDQLDSVRIPVKNAVATLVLGILSLVGCMFYGVLSFILGIIALAISTQPNKDYAANPSMYDQATYRQLNAGRICAIVALSLSVVIWIILFVVFYIISSKIQHR
jgi:uncharacterized membrane-anchored protein